VSATLTLSRLRVFLAVAQSQSISIASEELMVSQPAVSAMISALQREIGARLIERDGRRIRLTEAGRRLETYARRVMALLDDAIDEVRAADARAHPRVRVGAVNTVAEYVLPPLLSAVRGALPDLDVQLDVSTRAHVWQRLEVTETHVAIAGRPPLDGSFRTLATRRNEIVVIAPPDRAVAPEDLARETWLLREPGSGTRALSEEFFAALGIAPEGRLTIGSNGAIAECVRVGLGISLVARDAVARDLDAGLLIEVATPLTPLQRAWHVVVNPSAPLPPAAARFVDVLLDCAQRLDARWSLQTTPAGTR
jgi:LysR family transcriptional regulator, low CO2-responsive transcriptional regulator